METALKEITDTLLKATNLKSFNNEKYDGMETALKEITDTLLKATNLKSFNNKKRNLKK